MKPIGPNPALIIAGGLALMTTSLVLLVLNDRIAAWTRKRQSREAFVRSMRRRAWAWPAIIVAAALAGAWAVSQAPNRARGEGPPYVFLLFAAFIAFIVHILYRRKSRGEPPTVVPKEPPAPTNPVSPWVWMIVIFMILGTVYSFSTKQKGGQADAGTISPLWLFLIIPGLLAVFVAAIWLKFLWQNHDRDVSRANRLADSDDVEGAIRDLTKAIAARGPSPKRLNGLAMLHFRKQDFPAAVPLLKQGYAMAPRDLGLRNNLAIALQNLERHGEAEPILEALAAEYPNQPAILNNLAVLRLKQGRIDEAEARWSAAEAVHRRTRYLSTSNRQAIDAVLADLRSQIAKARGEAAESKPEDSSDNEI